MASDRRSGSVGDGGFDCSGEAREGSEGIVDRTGFISTVNHAVPALFITALLSVLFPSGVFHQLFEGRDIAVLEEVAGFLPTEDVVGGVAPRSAIVVDIALEELEEIRGEVELPGFFTVRENLVKKFLCAFTAEEVLLVGCFLITVARGEHHSLDLELHHFIKKFPNAGWVGSFEKGGVCRDAESAGDRFLDSFKGDFVCPIAANGGVVFRFQSVHVNAEGEIFGRLKEINLSFQKEGIGAEINVLFSGDESFDDLVDLGMNQGFASGNRDHRGTAFVRSGPALFGSQSFIEDVVWVLDFSATRTS